MIESYVMEDSKETFKCEFCNKTLLSERSFVMHSCEKKIRWDWRNEKPNQIGFRAYQRFYSMRMNTKKPRTYQQFINFKMYNDFVKFGKYAAEMQIINISGFIDYLIKSNIKINDWCSEWVFKAWILYHNRSENIHKAIERTLLFLEKWAVENNTEWYYFFDNVPAPLLTKYLMNGRISPLFIFIFNVEVLEKLSDEQLVMLKDIISPVYWKSKINEHKTEFDVYGEIKNIFKREKA